MHWRWLIGDYADAGYRLTRDQRREISRRAQEHHLPAGAFARRTFLVVLPPIAAAFIALRWAINHFLAPPRSDAMLIGLAVIVFLVWPWSAWAYGSVYARPFRRAMRDIGLSPCLSCGYRLDGLTLAETPRCPECGAPSELPAHAAAQS